MYSHKRYTIIGLIMAIKITRTKIIIIVIVFVVLVGGALSWFLLFNKSGTPALTDDQKNPDKVNTTATNLYFSSRNFDEANKAYDQAIGANTDPKALAELYRYKATLYLNDKKYDEAITLAKKSDGYLPTRFSADLLGEIYLAQGNKAEAINSFKLAISRLDTDGYNDITINTKDYYEARIREAQ